MLRSMIFITFLFFWASAQAQPIPLYASFDDMIERTYRASIVKIDVKSANTVFDDKGISICQSQGTGFLLNGSHVATAEHVYRLPDACGDPIIVIKSATNNLQKIAYAVAVKDDVAILQIEGQFPPSMCALRIRAQDVYGVQAIRFGIPGGLNDTQSSVGVRIGIENSEFQPLTSMTPTITERGESGGPVIFQLNVVGMTKSRHERYPGLSFMTVANTLRDLMTSKGVTTNGHICDISESTGFIFNRQNQGNVGSSITGLNKGSVFNNFSGIQLPTSSDAIARANPSINSATTGVMFSEKDYWDIYVEAAAKRGKWSNIKEPFLPAKR